MTSEKVTTQGVLELHPKGYGFLRNPARHYAAQPGDPYVPEPLVKRFSLREAEGEKGEPQLVLHCAFQDLGRMQRALEERGVKPLSAGHEYVCTSHVELPEEQAKEVLELIDALEQDDDVQRVSHTLA